VRSENVGREGGLTTGEKNYKMKILKKRRSKKRSNANRGRAWGVEEGRVRCSSREEKEKETKEWESTNKEPEIAFKKKRNIVSRTNLGSAPWKKTELRKKLSGNYPGEKLR